jgi:hypothetical protein
LRAIWGVTLGLSIGTKVTAPIILVPVTVWLIISFFTSRRFRQTIPLPRLLPLISVVGFVGVGVFVFVWPWLWDDPMGKLTTAWNFFRIAGFGSPVTYMGKIYQGGITLPRTFPFAVLGTKTPIELLLLAIVGMGAVWSSFRAGRVYATLAFFWFWLLILRFLVPGIIIFEKIRHFIDVMPGFFLLVGFGLQWLGSVRFKKKWTLVAIAIFLFSFGHELFIMVRFYPYEPTYYNALIGGIRTVSAHRLFDTEHMASSVKEGMDFVNRQPGNPSVYVCQVTHLGYFYAAPQVTVVRYPEPGSYVLVPNSPSWFGEPIARYSKSAERVYTVTRDGGDLLYVYRTGSTVIWYCGPESDTVLPARWL